MNDSLVTYYFLIVKFSLHSLRHTTHGYISGSFRNCPVHSPIVAEDIRTCPLVKWGGHVWETDILGYLFPFFGFPAPKNRETIKLLFFFRCTIHSERFQILFCLNLKWFVADSSRPKQEGIFKN